MVAVLHWRPVSTTLSFCALRPEIVKPFHRSPEVRCAVEVVFLASIHGCELS